MKTIETKVYKYHELSDSAKDKARDWLLSCYPDHGWWESVYEDAERSHLIITGHDIGRGNVIDIFYESWNDADDVAMYILNNHGGGQETHKESRRYIDEIKKTWDPDKEEEWEYDERAEEWSKEFLKTIGEEYLSMLRREFEYLSSEEQLVETIEANEYTFTEDGKRFG